MKLVKTIANLGYGSRKEVAAMFRTGRLTDARGEVLYADVSRHRDGPSMARRRSARRPGADAHNPTVYVFSPATQDGVYRSAAAIAVRSPPLSPSPPRRYTSVLLCSPMAAAAPCHRPNQTYDVYAPRSRSVARDEAALFAGRDARILEDATAAAEFEALRRRVRGCAALGPLPSGPRMFAAVGNHVWRCIASVGGLSLDDLPAGQWHVRKMSHGCSRAP